MTMTSAREEEKRSDDMLWCVNIEGPDDVVAVDSRQQAISASMWFNQWWVTNFADKGLHPDDPVLWAVPKLWPHDAQSHANDLAARGGEYGFLRDALAKAKATK